VTNDIYVYVVDLPNTVNEIVTPCNFGFTIYINAKLGYSGRIKAYNHAMKHIEDHDFESEEDIQTIEARVHRREE